MDILQRAKRSVCAALAAVVIISAVSETKTAEPGRQMFLFPQFSSAAASDTDRGADETDGRITYSFKIAELLQRFFGR